MMKFIIWGGMALSKDMLGFTLRVQWGVVNVKVSQCLSIYHSTATPYGFLQLAL